MQMEPVDDMQQQMPMDNEQPPMEGDMEMGDEQQMPMDGQMPNGEEQNPYDTDFDAGIDTDEETDPKRYIQQLTGKLSQSLRKYQEDLPTPDADLDKYVAGMILKQATEGLDDEDTKDVLKKINGKDDDDVDESISRKGYKNIDEIINDILGNQDDDENVDIEKKDTNVNFRKLPFTAPTFD